MRAFILLLWFCILTAPCLHAGPPPPTFYDLDLDHTISGFDAVPSTSNWAEEMILQVEDDNDSKPKLTWIPKPASTVIQFEEIGRFREKPIYRVTYRDPNDADPKSSSILFGFLEQSGADYQLRPFLWLNAGWDFSGVESLLTFDGTNFALEVTRRYSGNGVCWDRHTFAFTSDGIYLLERKDGGRKMPVKTIRYAKSGKVLKKTSIWNKD